ncbi:MAG TPA: alpha/beta hydrolase-fold protein [Ferruginibacter sp.]|nr:alpha/beta hydrolase-fold protein [Ferruginibacter sp.]HMP22093.1 alpha/beta hydrolase-fold protein [Ferruginibacter sp.]
MRKQNPAIFFAGRCMKACLSMGMVLLVIPVVSAQISLKIIIDSLPASHRGEPVFAAGNFNGWHPDAAGYQFLETKDKPVLQITLPAAGALSFKCTRGAWDKVEGTATGTDISNRFIQVTADTTVHISIAGWKDDTPAAAKIHTIAPGIKLLDTILEMPQLQRKRRVWVCLPPGYAASKKAYPVLYMQDGQNIFDAYTSSYGEWGVDECMDSMVATGWPACIIVGIEHGSEKRLSEYSPYAFTLGEAADTQTIHAEGRAYVDFLVQTVRPHINKQYRTITSNRNTFISGSSMGGLISLYAMYWYPDVFGKAGVFSPSFWVSEQIKTDTEKYAPQLTGKLFFYIGEKEGSRHVKNMEEIAAIIGEKSKGIVLTVTDPEEEHNEAAWQKWFAEFYKWVLADGYNVKGGIRPE